MAQALGGVPAGSGTTGPHTPLAAHAHTPPRDGEVFAGAPHGRITSKVPGNMTHQKVRLMKSWRRATVHQRVPPLRRKPEAPFSEQPSEILSGNS